jgi:hypothetical protein
MKFDPFPPIAVLPLGTGNDLSRTLGWGPGYENEPLAEIIQSIDRAKIVAMDRWSVRCVPIEVDSSPSSSPLGFESPKRGSKVENAHSGPSSSSSSSSSSSAIPHQEVASPTPLLTSSTSSNSSTMTSSTNSPVPFRSLPRQAPISKAISEQCLIVPSSPPTRPESSPSSRSGPIPSKNSVKTPEVMPKDEGAGVPSSLGEPKCLVMNNYFSVGVDAEVALKFHKLREEKPKYFRSRFINKGWYGLYGMEGMIKNCGPLYKVVSLYLDNSDAKVEYAKDITGIIFLNISSYGGGTDPWGPISSKSKRSVPSMSDGLLEVIGVTGSDFEMVMNIAFADVFISRNIPSGKNSSRLSSRHSHWTSESGSHCQYTRNPRPGRRGTMGACPV